MGLNRIVVDYGNLEEVYLISVIETCSGIELDIHIPEFRELNPVKKWEFTSYLDLRDKEEPNREGFVVKFDNSSRFKIKFSEYLRLHKIVTNTSSYDIWNTLKNNGSVKDLLERVPDEFGNWLYQTVGKMYLNYRDIEQQVERDWDYGISQELYYMGGYNWLISPGKSRREVAQYFRTCQHPDLMFNKLDGVDYMEEIWKKIKPKHEKAFGI